MGGGGGGGHSYFILIYPKGLHFSILFYHSCGYKLLTEAELPVNRSPKLAEVCYFLRHSIIVTMVSLSLCTCILPGEWVALE